jgi:hypothetical protein
VNRSFGAASPPGRGGQFGQRNTLTFGLHFHNSDANLTNPFPSLGGKTSVRSFDVPISYARSIGRLTNIARFDFNRSRTCTQNLYAFNQNVAGDLGITDISGNPFDWGLPDLSFTNFAGLQDTKTLLLCSYGRGNSQELYRAKNQPPGILDEVSRPAWWWFAEAWAYSCH